VYTHQQQDGGVGAPVRGGGEYVGHRKGHIGVAPGGGGGGGKGRREGWCVCMQPKHCGLASTARVSSSFIAKAKSLADLLYHF
jgi:hypothetical protein